MYFSSSRLDSGHPEQFQLRERYGESSGIINRWETVLNELNLHPKIHSIIENLSFLQTWTSQIKTVTLSTLTAAIPW